MRHLQHGKAPAQAFRLEVTCAHGRAAATSRLHLAHELCVLLILLLLGHDDPRRELSIGLLCISAGSLRFKAHELGKTVR